MAWQVLWVALICSSFGFKHAVSWRLGGGIRRGHLRRYKTAMVSQMRGEDLPWVARLAVAFGGLDDFDRGRLVFIAFFIYYKPL